MDVIDGTADVDESDLNVSWAAYHAHRQPSLPTMPTDISVLLPLFKEDSKSIAMMCHGMDVIKSNVQFLNLGQTQVVTLDQPLYAIAKKVQWHCPGTYGENNFVLMLGGLHIEMAAWKTLGDWLQGSGWTSSLTQTGIASSGMADSFLKASYV